MKKERALVTGSNRGIGKAIAEKLYARGCYVVGTSTDGSGPEGFVDEWLKADFSTINGIKRFCDFIEKMNAFDVLVNNAGINIIKSQDKINDHDYDKIENVNLKAPFYISRDVAKKMSKNEGGRIVNISSIWSVISKSQRTLYSTMKAGINGMTRSMSVEWGNRRILINSISPGFVKTELTKNSLSMEEMNNLKNQIPLNRFAETNEIAEVVSFLVSKKNNYITGQNIVVDGGFSII